jgi:hypothetical protein
MTRTVRSRTRPKPRAGGRASESGISAAIWLIELAPWGRTIAAATTGRKGWIVALVNA